MSSLEDVNGDPELQPKPAKRQRKVGFSSNVGVDPNSCIRLRLVTSSKDMEDYSAPKSEFVPNFAERFFNDDGKIYGYKDLKIIIWFHALSFYAHVEISHGGIIQDSNGVKSRVTDLQKAFKEILGDGLIEERDAFIQRLSSSASIGDLIHQHGKILTAWKMSNEPSESWIQVANDSHEIEKEILLMDDLTSNEVNDWHARLTPLVLMFIEAASPIDKKDPRWEVYVCLRKESSDNERTWRLMGFCTVYRFYKYPDSTRLRVSQILVLPPYQHQQNGLHLLEAVYKTAIERESFEVTMEEPSDELQALRECMDTMRLITFEPVRSELHNVLVKLRNGKLKSTEIGTPEWMPTIDLVEKVRQTLKICRLQFQHCWQVLIYLHMMNGGDEARALFRDLLSSFVKIEIFGGPKSSNVGKNKQLIDVENEYDSSRTFVMFKAKYLAKDSHDECEKNVGSEHLNAAIDMDPEGKTESAYQELLEERVDEIRRIGDRVLKHLESTGIVLDI